MVVTKQVICFSIIISLSVSVQYIASTTHLTYIWPCRDLDLEVKIMKPAEHPRLLRRWGTHRHTHTHTHGQTFYAINNIYILFTANQECFIFSPGMQSCWRNYWKTKSNKKKSEHHRVTILPDNSYHTVTLSMKSRISCSYGYHVGVIYPGSAYFRDWHILGIGIRDWEL